MARIYTRTGDRGETSLLDGSRTSKADPRVDLYGDVDELNSLLGVAAAALAPDGAGREATPAATPTGTPATTATAAGGRQADAAGEDSLPPPATSLELAERLGCLQRTLFELGAILADPARSRELAAGEAVDLPFAPQPLEREIDGMTAALPRLRNFILPGGHPAAAHLHHARTVCRRAERRAVALAGAEPVPPGVVVYLNRLSDYLFVAARWANHLSGRRDVLWSRP